MPEPFPWESELKELHLAVKSVAGRPVPLDDPNWGKRMRSPLTEAGVRKEANAFVLRILADYEVATDKGRAAIRRLVPKNSYFFWAVVPPATRDPVASLRRRLIYFAIVDQYPDPRDAVLWLDELCNNPRVTEAELAEVRREVAPLASDKDRYGVGSTRSLLLRGSGGGYGRRGAPSRQRAGR